MTVRTLRNWKKLDPSAPPARPGRAPTPEGELERARSEVRGVLEEQGWAVGERTVKQALPDVPMARIRRVLRALKAEHRRSLRRVRERTRASLQVDLRDALWGQDATHLGRDDEGCEVQGEVLRDIASTRSIDLGVGPAAAAVDVIGMLERTKKERGTAPLVYVTDNGPQYVNALVAKWLTENEVVHLKNEPHTPQHNSWTEHGHRELKEEGALGKGVRIGSEEARARLERSRERIDHHRLRRSRGWRTAVQADEDAVPWSARIDRRAFYARATCAIEQAVQQYEPGRARRRAEREAILQTLERFSAITRTRGGVLITQSIEEGNA